MKTASKLKVRFTNLVRPDGYPVYVLDQRMGIFRWMVKMAEKMDVIPGESGHWGVCNALNLLSCNPTCVNAYRVDPIVSLEDLDRRFHYALLSRFAGRQACRWRQENRVLIGETRWVYMPFRKFSTPVYRDMSGSSCRHSSGPSGLWSAGRSEADIERLFKRLLSARNQKTRPQLNSCHAEADTVKGVRLYVTGAGYRFVMWYGFRDEEHGSAWDHELCEPLDEPFLTSLDRACEEMVRVTEWSPP